MSYFTQISEKKITFLFGKPLMYLRTTIKLLFNILTFSPKVYLYASICIKTHIYLFVQLRTHICTTEFSDHTWSLPIIYSSLSVFSSRPLQKWSVRLVNLSCQWHSCIVTPITEPSLAWSLARWCCLICDLSPDCNL